MLKKIVVILLVIISVIGVGKLLLKFYVDYVDKKEITMELKKIMKKNLL